MNIILITIGKCRDKAIISLADEYIKRLKAYGKTTLIELPHATGRPGDIKNKEAESILNKIPSDSLVIALDERGKKFGTSALADFLQTKKDQGTRALTLIIGGAEGLDEKIRQKADLTLSFSDFTFPHMLMRPLILEQLYRCFSYSAGHPYHREG